MNRTFSYWLKQLRARHDFTQELLAEQVGCSLDTVRALETGRRRPSRAMAERLAEVLHVAEEQRAEFIRLARSASEGDLAALAGSEPVEARPPLRPARLPVMPTSFIGRVDEAAEVVRHLGAPACRLLTILGPGGTGKTRLALQVVTELQARGSRVVTFIGLSQVATVEHVPVAIAEALGCPLAATATAEESLLRFLADRELLLVLDNLEHVLDACPLLAALLREAPGVQLLVTSRERLRLQGELVFQLGGLATPHDDSRAAVDRSEAVILFLERARNSSAEFALTSRNRAAVGAICRLVDGMPLGIELAAAWVRALSPEEIAAEIARGLDFLSLSSRDVAPRHRSMRAVIDHSWALLTEEERRVLGSMAIFRGGCTREAATTVAGASLPVLAGLLDKSLVRRGESGRYELHELVRQYAAEKLGADPAALAAARARHGAYYTDWLSDQGSQITGADQDRVVAEITAEIENIRAAWQHGVEQRALRPVWQLADNGLLWFYEVRGWYQEAEQACRRATEAFREPPPGSPAEEQLLGSLLGMQGWFSFRRGHPEVGARLLEESVCLLRDGDQPQWLFNSLVQLAYLALFQGAYRRAETLIEEQLELVQRIATPWAHAHTLVLQGALDADRMPERAYTHLHERLPTIRAVGDPHLLLLGLTYLGDAALNLGYVAEAEQVFREAQRRSAQMHSGIIEVLALSGLAAAAVVREAWADAVRDALYAVARSGEVGEIWSRAKALTVLGEAEAGSGDRQAARLTLVEALRLSVSTGLLPTAIRAWVGLGRLELHQPARRAGLPLLTALVRHHDATDQRTAAYAGQLWDALSAYIDEDALQEAEGQARTMAPERLVPLLGVYVGDVG